MAKLKSHPYADLFPMMTPAELDALAADIAENGLRQPVVLYQDAVLDGRNRLMACVKAGVEPSFTTHEGDDASALALVISLNVQRRDLTAAQRAIVAAKALPLFEEAGEKRMLTGKSADGEAGGRGKKKPSGGSHPRVSSTAESGKVFKVGEQSVKQAKAILAEAADLAAQVEVCTLALAAAYEQLQERRKQAAQKAKDAERVAEFADAISSGEMQLEEALQKAIEAEREEKERLATQADARGHWLKEFVEFVEWVERFISPRNDEHLEWYTKPDSPGLFNHGITAERVAAVIFQLERARAITFGAFCVGNQNGNGQRGTKDSSRVV